MLVSTMKTMEENIQNNIKKYREAMGLTQPQLAEKMGLGEYGQQQVSQWENGKRSPNKKTLAKIAEILRQPVEAFMVEDYESMILERLKSFIQKDKKMPDNLPV